MSVRNSKWSEGWKAVGGGSPFRVDYVKPSEQFAHGSTLPPIR